MTKAASPFEPLFDLEPGSTEELAPAPKTGLVDVNTGEMVEMAPDADSSVLDKEERLEDIALVKQFEEIQSKAMQAFTQQQTLSQEVDPKFSARNSEVAAQFLNIALAAVKDRSEAKYKRQKMRLAGAQVGKPSQVQNNLVIADRNDLLRNLFRQDFEKPLGQQISDELNPNK